jgi:tetratricopeptide (TPR) repeat protein
LVYVVGAGLGRVDEAEVLAKAAHVACRRVGDNPSLGARLCNSLGLVRLAAGRAAAAAGEFERALALDERTYGARHWFVALSALNLSEAYLDAGDAARAAPTLARAAEICSPEAPSPSPTRARCLWLMARLAEAQADTRRAHAGYLAAAGAFARCPGELERAEAARAAAGRLAGALGASPTPPGAERGA